MYTNLCMHTYKHAHANMYVQRLRTHTVFLFTGSVTRETKRNSARMKRKLTNGRKKYERNKNGRLGRVF